MREILLALYIFLFIFTGAASVALFAYLLVTTIRMLRE